MAKCSVDYLMITPAYPPHIGGVERHVCEVHRSLTKSGLTGRVLVLDQHQPAADSSDDVKWIGPSGLLLRLPKGPTVQRCIRTAEVIFESHAARIHFHDVFTIYPLLPVLRLLGWLRRAYLTFHGWEGVFPPDPEVIRKRRQCANAVVGKMAIGDFIPKWYGTPVDMVSYGGVDVNSYGSIGTACDSLPFRLAYLGRFERDTGIVELIKASRDYCRISGCKIDLHLFGRGSLQTDLLQLQSDPWISVTVSEPVRDISVVLREFPVIFASGYLSILEALCARRIVFAYYNNRLREDYLRLHPASGSMFICGSARDVLGNLALCHRNIRRACKLSQAGWTWAAKQSWENLASQYRDLWSLS